jgi:hypothetical protein
MSAGPGPLRALLARATAPPPYETTPADLQAFDLFGLRLPIRATVTIAVVTFAILFDYSRTFLPPEIMPPGRGPDALRVQAIERAILFGLVPLAVIVLGFRDRPSRYGVTLGDARWGLALMLAGCVIMTPIVLWFATLPDAQAYYAVGAGPIPDVIVTNALELTAAEFALRGFLAMVLIRTIGPLGVLVAVMPFVFAHLGKPEVELFSTLFGGMAYGWLAWRTQSIVWGSIAHVYILTLVTVAAGGAG